MHKACKIALPAIYEGLISGELSNGRVGKFSSQGKYAKITALKQVLYRYQML